VSSLRRARPFVGAASLALAAALALGCDVLAGDDDSETQAASVTDSVLPGCEATDSVPNELRCTGLYTDIAAKTLSPRARAFAPAVAFWSDGAEKLRWVDLPDGSKIDTASMDEWRYPVGTKVWKEFRVAGKRVETRFMHKVRDDRWLQAAYVWSPDEMTATRGEGTQLEIAGATYAVPKTSECNDCHKGKKDKLLGFEAISLGQPAATGLTLAALASEARLTAPPAQTSVPIGDDGSGKSAPALAWLHVNCGTSCHTGTATATAYGTGLRLRIGWDELTGKPPRGWEMVKATVEMPVKSPKWSGEVRIVPGDPQSSLLFRLLAQRGAEQMPPIATRIVDDAGKSAVESWINAMPPTTIDLGPAPPLPAP
jgi:hypothetical protein